MMLLRIDLGFKNIGKSEKGSSISVDMGATGETVSKSKKDHLENLMKLPGVGKATAQKLYDSGIKSPAGVNKAGKKGLADAGISAAISKKLLAAVAKTAAKKTTAKAKYLHMLGKLETQLFHQLSYFLPKLIPRCNPSIPTGPRLHTYPFDIQDAIETSLASSHHLSLGALRR